MQENKTLKAFWVEYSMEEAMQWTEAELEEKIEDFITRLAKRSLDRDPNWWYPEWKRIDMRHYK